MALKIGELYAVLGLESKDFYKDLDEAEKGMTGLSSTFFKAVTASQQHGKAVYQQQQKVEALEKLVARSTKTLDDYSKAIEAQTKDVSKAKEELAALGEGVDKTTKEYKKKSAAVKDAETTLEEANAEHKKAIAQQKDLQSALVSANAELKSQSSAWSKLATVTGNAGKLYSEVGEKLTKKVTVPLAGIGTTALWAGINFESAFAGVEKTVDGTAEELADIRAGIRGMANDIPTTTTELSKIAEAAGQLGIETGNVLGFARVMADLKETTNLGDDGATQLARFVNITQMSQKNFGRLGSSVVALGNTYATTESEIVSMSLRLGAAGKQANMSEADILGIAASLSSLGIESEAGGSAFSKVISSMQLATETGGKDLKNFAGVAKMSTDEFVQLFKEDASAALDAFIQGLATGGDSAIKTLDDIGISEIRMRDALLRASGAGTLFADAIADSNRAWKDNTALTKEAETRYKTTASKLKVLGNQAKDIGIDFGELMIPYLQEGVGVVGDLISGFSNLGEAEKTTVLHMGAFAAAIGPVSSVLGKTSSGISTAITKFKDFKTSMASAGGGAKGFMSAMGPMAWVTIAVAAGVAVAKIYDYISGAKAAREATEALNKTASEWKDTQAKTIFDSGNDPFSALRLDRSIFATAVEMSKADTKELKSLDKEYNNLIKKKAKQGDDFSPDDQARLDEIYNRRYEIKMDYALGEITGFEEIEKSVAAKVAELKALGFSDEEINASVYGDAINAANAGNLQNMESLSAKYAEQYAMIQQIEDGNERAAAQAALDSQYQQERNEALGAYADTLLRLSGYTLGTNEMKDAKGDIDDVHSALLKFASSDKGNGAISDLKGDIDALDLDEGELASYMGLLSQMQQLRASGVVSEAELATMFPDLAGQEETLKNILGYLQQYSDVEALSGLNTMFNEAVPEEVERVFGDVQATIVSAVVDDNVILPVIDGLEGSIAAVSKGEKLEWEGELPKINAVAEHIINEIPESEWTLEQKALVNAYLNKDSLTGDAVLGVWTDFLKSDDAKLVLPVEVEPTITKIPFNETTFTHVNEKLDRSSTASLKLPEQLETITGDLKGLGLGGLWSGVMLLPEDWRDIAIFVEQYNALSAALEDGETIDEETTAKAAAIQDFFTSLGSASEGADAESIQSMMQMLKSAFAGTSLEDMLPKDIGSSLKTAMDSAGKNAGDGYGDALANADISDNAQTFVDGAIDDVNTAQDSNPPAKEFMPSGENAAAGYGEGMENYNFATNANKVATNANSKLTSANVAKLSAYKLRGSYIAAGVAKGMAEYDFSTEGKTLVENILAAIRAATGEGSPAKAFFPRGYWGAAGVGKGLTQYDFTKDANRTTDNLMAALAHAAPPSMSADAILSMTVRESEALQNFTRQFEDEMTIKMPPRKLQTQQKFVVNATADFDYEQLAEANSKRPVRFSVGGRELAQANVNDNSRTITEKDSRVRSGYGGR